MRTALIIIISSICILLSVSLKAQSQSTSDFLILGDIGNHKLKIQSKDFITGQPRNIPGYSSRVAPGCLASADHFDADHDDKTYETKYLDRYAGLGIEVQVTQHSGDESDKWLLHEIERDFRNYSGLSDNSYVVRQIDGNAVLAVGAGGWVYRWRSGTNIVVNVSYTDLMMEKPEPLEVVKAYLAKHPSSIPFSTLKELRDQERQKTWIKDEMDRRLWLCDKWFKELQFKRVEEKDVYREAVRSMIVFIDYREKFYGIKVENDKNLLDSYIYENNGTGIRAKLTEYKNWWGVNKSKAISL